MTTGLVRNGFIEIDLEILRIDTVLGFDLYLPGPRGYVLYRSRHVPFNERVRQNLLAHGVKALYAKAVEYEKYNAYLESNLANIVADPKVRPELKSQLVYDSSIKIAKDLLSQPGSIKTVKRSARAVECLVELHLKDHGGFRRILALMPTDYRLYTHCANVATFSIAIGRQLGIDNRSDLFELGLGALLHDIGKSQVPAEILNKPQPLTPEEFAVVKEHVRYGYYMAQGNPVVPRQALLPVLWHHERLSGTGYPAGKKSGEIPLFGMIAAVADAFDAMTSDRVYQKALSAFEAMKILFARDDQYDRRVVMKLATFLAPQREQTQTQVESELVYA